MSFFERHPAFVRGIDRARQVKQLKTIRDVMPVTADIAAAWVWTAMLDERAVPHAMRALDEMPEESRYRVFSMSRALA